MCGHRFPPSNAGQQVEPFHNEGNIIATARPVTAQPVMAMLQFRRWRAENT